MGVPELLKYVARTVPGALGRPPQRKDKAARSTADSTTESDRKQRLPTLWYDYIIVDATNVVQTIGLESLRQMLCDDDETVAAIGVRGSIIMVVDGIRQRQGSARAGRAHVTTQSSDLAIQKFVQTFIQSEHHRVRDLNTEVKKTKRNRDDKDSTVDEGAAYKPADLRFVGRDHFGEGDFKILNLHRRIAFGSAVPTAAKNSKTPVAPVDPAQLPTFLFVSEDADLFCGALCGPFPQNVSIGTQLREVTADMCILSLEKVLVAIGQATGVFYSPNTIIDTAPPKANKTSESKTATSGETAIPTADAKVETSEEYLRSMLPDGAKSKKTKFEDSDDDDDDINPTALPPLVKKEEAPKTAAAKKQAAVLSGAARTEQEVQRMARDLHTSCRDFIFIFTMILGNDVLPGAVQGATKVDAAACWQAYCSKKYSVEEDITHTLLTVPDAEGAEDDATPTTAGRESTAPMDDDEEARLDPKHTVSVHTDFLSMVVSGLHLADTAARPPVTEERRLARAYLRKLTSVIFHYTTGPLIDTRDDQVEKKAPPSLAALLQVLSSKDERPAEYKAVCDPASSHAMSNGATVGMGYGLPATNNGHPLKYTVKKPSGTSVGTMAKEHAALPGSANLSAAVSLFSKGSTNPADLLPTEGKLGQPVMLATLECAWSRSLVPTIGKLKRESENMTSTVKSTGEAAAASKGRFGFDTRRMMPMATPVGAEADATAAGAYLSAAGISTSYGATPLPPKAKAPVKKTGPKEIKVPSFLAKKEQALNDRLLAQQASGMLGAAKPVVVAEVKPTVVAPVIVPTLGIQTAHPVGTVPAAGATPAAAGVVAPGGEAVPVKEDWDKELAQGAGEVILAKAAKKKRPGAKERQKMKNQFEAYQKQQTR